LCAIEWRGALWLVCVTENLGLCHAFDRNLVEQLQVGKVEVEGAEEISPRFYFKN
jgi:hypothetical protein